MDHRPKCKHKAIKLLQKKHRKKSGWPSIWYNIENMMHEGKKLIIWILLKLKISTMLKRIKN